MKNGGDEREGSVGDGIRLGKANQERKRRKREGKIRKERR